MSNTERSWNLHARKHLQNNSIKALRLEPLVCREPKQFLSREWTRAYRQRLQNQFEWPKQIPFSNREQGQTFYAKKQQMHLKTTIQLRATTQVGPEASNMEDVGDLIQNIKIDLNLINNILKVESLVISEASVLQTRTTIPTSLHQLAMTPRGFEVV
ncbi:hypothetical protein L873DRAFT_1793479 [Choiromyces venosus 120613-1]|uniref:Uncharacterized protein n=1 Tax=Choiromyces venosus 120613-1 TaxID=1336337 RepID=A0A3N4J670_9PEZI|nr:hypothetical protein L873DRAFT_1793479 [Choiromyces venosus 120613-1]